MNDVAQNSDEAAFEWHLLTLFPDFFTTPLSVSILGRAIQRGDVRARTHNIRDWTEGKHRIADDTPYGGGAGMVMKPGPIVRCLEAVEAMAVESGGRKPHRIALTPAGTPFSQEKAQELASKGAISLVCGRYEGFDERVMASVDEELSLGDFVLTGGEPAALTVVDAVTRLLPGVLGNAHSAEDESFGVGLLEYPQYTRPAVFRGVPVPEILTSGDHGKIDDWRRGQALLRTTERRPELMDRYKMSEKDARLLKEAMRHRLSVEEVGAEGHGQSAQEDP